MKTMILTLLMFFCFFQSCSTNSTTATSTNKPDEGLINTPLDSIPNVVAPKDTLIVITLNPEEDSLYQIAIGYYNAKQFVEAINEFNSIKQDYPSFSDPGKLNYYLARSYQEVLDSTSAFDLYSEMILDAENDPWRDDALYQLGLIERGKATPASYDLALQYFNLVLDSFLTSNRITECQYFAGEINNSLENFSESQKYLVKYLNAVDNQTYKDMALYLAGKNALVLNDNYGADSLMSRYISEYPLGVQLTNAYFWRGKAKLLQSLTDSIYAKNQLSKSINDFDNYLAISPSGSYGSESQLLKGEALFFQNYFSEAIVELEKVESVYPTSLDIAPSIYYIGRAKMDLLDYSGAIIDFRRILADFKSSARLDDAQFQIGKSLYRIGEPIEGSFVVQDSLKIIESITNLKLVLSDYPTSSKIDNALLYLVRAYSEIQDCVNADLYLNQMKKDYSTSTLLPLAINHSSYIHYCKP